MKRLLSAVLLLSIISFSLPGQETGEYKVFRGCGGGMMLSAGYASGNIDAIGYRARGATFGIGGLARVCLGDHWRTGFEGYMSTMGQLGNGSYVKYGWGGLFGDYCWHLGKFIPHLGLTLGGGVNKDYLMFGNPEQDWTPVKEAYFNRRGFMALDPFIGCEYAVADGFHLNLRLDWLCCVSRKSYEIPTGPRLYIGFIFCH